MVICMLVNQFSLQCFSCLYFCLSFNHMSLAEDLCSSMLQKSVAGLLGTIVTEYSPLYLQICCNQSLMLDRHTFSQFIWLSVITHLNNTCILPIFLYGSDCWAISKTDARRINALDQWCLCMLLGIKWYQFVRNDDVRRLTKQPKLTAIIQSRRLTLFGHIMRMDDNADAKRILLASPPADWRRQLGRPRITWFSTVQQDLKWHHITLPKAADLAQNRPVWRMMSAYGATQS